MLANCFDTSKCIEDIINCIVHAAAVFNLALENWLFLEELKDEKIIFLWQNSPCVVIGRAQNPWLECNLEAMKNDDVNIARRQSGGGSVFHDYGNFSGQESYLFLLAKKPDSNSHLTVGT